MLTAEQQLCLQLARGAEKLAENGDHRGAVRGLVSALKCGLPPAIASVAAYNLGLSLSTFDASADAATAFGKAAILALEKDRKAEAYGKRGDSLARIAQWSEAGEAYGHATLYSDDPRYSLNAAAAFINANSDRALYFLENVSEDSRDSLYYAHLTTAYSIQSNNELATIALNQISLNLTSLLFAAMLLESKANDKHLAIHALERIVFSDQNLLTHDDPHTSSVLYRLSRLYTAFAREHDVAYIRELAYTKGIWLHPFQQPGYVVPALRKLHVSTIKPWISTSSNDTSCTNEFDQVWQPLLRLKSRLENELFSIARQEWQHISAQQAFSPDDEGIAIDPEAWHQFIFRRNGKWLPELNNTFPRTVALLHDILDNSPEEYALHLPKGSAQISILRPGATLVPHCGPSNHRIRFHLTLESDGSASITVGDPSDPNNTHYHQPGVVFIFDDSFLHSAQIPFEASYPRVVILIDVWHPALSRADRDSVRKHFLYDPNDAFGWRTTHSPFGPTTLGLAIPH